MRYSVSRVEALLNDLAPFKAPVSIREPLTEDECRWFLRAVDEGIVSFTTCDATCFRFKKWKKNGPDDFETPAGKPRHLFSKPNIDSAWLNREYIPHIAAYARAILEFGYDRKNCSFSKYQIFKNNHKTRKKGSQYETDAEFYDADGKTILLQIEAKAQARQIAQLAENIDQCSSLNKMPEKVAKEVEYVRELKPKYLWVVGPGTVDPARHVYRVEQSGGDVRFIKVSTLPLATSLAEKI